MKVLEKVMEEINNPNKPLDIDFFRENKISSEIVSKIEELKLKEREPYYKRAKYTLDANTLTATSLSGILKNKTPEQ